MQSTSLPTNNIPIKRFPLAMTDSPPDSIRDDYTDLLDSGTLDPRSASRRPERYVEVPPGYELRPKRPRGNASIIAAAIIIGCAIIAAALLLSNGSPLTNAEGDETGIQNGAWVDYDLTLTSGENSVDGTCRITYSGLTETSGTATFTMNIGSQTTTQAVKMWSENGQWYYDLGGSTATVTPVDLGESTIQTAIGKRTVIQYSYTTPDFVEIDWLHETGAVLRSHVTYLTGDLAGWQMKMEITGSNIKSI